MKNSKIFDVNLFEKIFDLNSKNKIGANTIAVFTFVLYKCEDLRKEIVISDYQMARELGLSRQTIITAKNKLKLLGLLDYNRNPGFPNRFILKGNQLPKVAPKTMEDPIKELDQFLESTIVGENSSSKYPSLKQFMDFARTLKDYSEKLDDLLIQKFHKWEEAEWKNSLGRPILNWQSTLEKNMNTLDVSLSNGSSALSNLPVIKRPKLD